MINIEGGIENMRLIDADVFEVVTFKNKSEEFSEGVKYILEIIDNEPTVYNVDKVIEQLVDLIQGSITEYGDGYNTAITQAIDIVKEGGIT